MVGIVIVSHSDKIAKGVEELVNDLVPRKAPLVAIGGDESGEIGTDLEAIIDTVKEIYSDKGVIIIGDLGSSLMNARTALEILELEGYSNVVVSGAPLVEGAMIATIESNLGKDLETIRSKIESKRMMDLL